MTGAILGGSSVEQAAKMQMIIMFMISASTALAAIFTTACAIGTAVDEEHRVRSDRIYTTPLALWTMRDLLLDKARAKVERLFWRLRGPTSGYASLHQNGSGGELGIMR